MYFTHDVMRVSGGDRTVAWRRLLADYPTRPGLRMLEIGSLEGMSAIWFCDNILTGPDCMLTCVDPWVSEKNYQTFMSNISERTQGAKIEVMRMKSAEAYPLFAGENRRFDLAYVDGDHRSAAVAFDAKHVWPLIKAGGVVMFDDYALGPERRREDRPKEALDEWAMRHAGEFELLEADWQFIVRKL